MGSLTWKGGPGSWSEAPNWIVGAGTDTIPSAGDDVVVNAPFNYVITVSGGQSAGNVLLNAAGAKLSISGGFALGGIITVQAGTLLATGAVLSGGTYAIAGGTDTITGGTLDGVTWGGALNLMGTVQVVNGISFIQGATATVGLISSGTAATGALVFADTAPTIDNVTLQVAATNQMFLANSGTLTLGTGATLETFPGTQGSPLLGDANDTIRNLGTIHADKQSFIGQVDFVGSLINEGAFVTTGGLDDYVKVAQTLTNSGTITINDSGGIGAGSLLNAGTIELRPLYSSNPAGIVRVSGDYSGLGAVIFNGGATGSTLATSSLIVGGTIAAGSKMIHQSGTMLITAGAIDPGATIENFSSGDAISLTSVPFTGNTNVFWSGTAGSGTLTVMDGSTLEASLHLTGIASTVHFSVGAGLSGISIATDNPAPCFTSDTRIATPSGPVAVERLRVGDRVVSGFGGAVPVQWIGHRRVDCRRHARPSEVWPIRIEAGALGGGVPGRDLRVSPEHALLIDGLLIPAGLLVNGVSIVREPCQEVTYWHVELPQHDVVLAEGAPCESYLDTGNRSDFDNGKVIAAHPAFAGATANEIWLAQACAPQCRDGAALEAIRARLAAIARGLEGARRAG